MADVQARHIMTKEVLTVRESATLAEAAGIMRKHRVSGLPVVDEARHVLGILSEKDILRSLEEPMPSSLSASLIDLVLKGLAEAHDQLRRLREHLEATRVDQVMTPDPIVVGPDASALDIAELMRERKINRVPVVEGKRLVGIVTRHDVLSAL
ncbi:MAG TPA: CBS domain-containing protein [Thermoplasmata archaeon]|nr:CBS domain-containing protein [Thermoplasmata archaeon]